jgi:hypothetical protein
MVSGGAADAMIGASGGVEPFTGLMDEVAIYDAALTESEIALHIQNVLAGQANYFVPEPTSASLLAWCFVGLGLYIRRRRA